MATLAPSFTLVHPNFIEPGVILPYVQASGAFETLAGGEPLMRLAEGDLYVYMKRIELRNRVAAGQMAYNQLPSVSTTLSFIVTPTYEAGDVARHHRRGRRSFKRDLHECVLHGHRRDAEHAREDRICRVRVDA